MSVWWLVPLGFALGTLGTLVGAGGGFLLAPMLLLLYPHDEPATIASISLAVVFLNALSGTIAYARMRRVDYKSGFLLSAATVPGAILGALTTSLLPRRTFDLLFAVVLTGGAVLLLWRPHLQASFGRGTFARQVTERDGTVHSYSYNPWLAAVLSLGVGFVSSVLGIGGGIIHVPILTAVLGFPVHIATGAFRHGAHRTAALGVGVLVGAQLGARLSNRVHGHWILRGLAAALILVALRLAFWPGSG